MGPRTEHRESHSETATRTRDLESQLRLYCPPGDVQAQATRRAGKRFQVEEKS